MFADFGWCGFWEAAWPLLAGLLALAAIRRQRPASPFVRLVGVFAALLLFTAAVSPRDPLTGQALIGDDIKTLAVTVGFLLGLIQHMLPGHTE
jgi:hypothetical protein